MNFEQLLEKTLELYPDQHVADTLKKSRTTIHRWKNGKSRPNEVKFIEDQLKGLINWRQGASDDLSWFTFIDLFAGIGGMRRGFESIGGKCVFTSEWDKFAQQTYRANFVDDHDIQGDITKIAASDIPPHDVLLAGFPCQPFSLAGVSKKKSLGRAHGFEDKTQGTLFFDVARIIGERRPAAFLLENVKNLMSHDRGRTIETILDVLRNDLGYTVLDPRLIDAQCFVPQHRERTFIVGFREDIGFSWDALQLPEVGPRLKEVLHPEDGSELCFPDDQGRFIMDDGAVLPKYTLSSKLWTYLKDYRAKHEAKGNGFGYSRFDETGVARTLSARYHKDGSEILITRGPRARPRRLTPRECARLMGYDPLVRPELDWSSVSPMSIPVSDTQAYRQFGNSVVVPVVRAIARTMEPGVRALVRESMNRTYSLPLSVEAEGRSRVQEIVKKRRESSKAKN